MIPMEAFALIVAACLLLLFGLPLFDGSWAHTGWIVFQGGVAYAVYYTNLQWHWTESRQLAVICGVIAAFLATAIATARPAKRR